MAASLAAGMGLAGAVATGANPAGAVASSASSVAPHPQVRLAHLAVPTPKGATVPSKPPVLAPRSTVRPAQVSARTVPLSKLEKIAKAGAPRFDASGTPVTTFVVTSTADSANENPSTGTTCVDTEATPACSLRAAVQAADNIGASASPTPVVIELGATTYHLTSDTTLAVTDPAGVSIVGTGEASTVIDGEAAVSVLTESPAGSAAGSPSLFLSNLTVADGSATYGGGIDVTSSPGDGASLSLDHVTVAHNTATDGGGIYAYYSTVHLTDSSVSSNSAAYGAGIYADDGDVIAASNTAIDSNSTTTGGKGYGGGLYAYYSVVSMSGGSISYDTAGDQVNGYQGEGGGIYDGDYSSYDLTGVAINHDTAAYDGYGGGIYGDYSTFHISGGTISNDVASSYDGKAGGGGIAAYDTAFTLDKETMALDQVTGVADGQGYGGGAIYDEPVEYTNEFSIKSSMISSSNNSAVYVSGYEGGSTWNISGTTFAGNTDAALNGGLYDESGYGCGGAFCVSDYEYLSTTLHLEGDTFTGNSSSGYFGAGAIVDFQNYYDGATISMKGDTFSSNVSTGEYGSGAVLLSNYEDAAIALSVTDSTFTGNFAADYGYGGAIDAYGYDDYSPITVDLKGDSFTGNSAGSATTAGDGGAVLTYDYVSLTDHGSTFRGNAVYGSDSGGGAIYDEGYESESLDGSRFIGNSAYGEKSYGGALYSEAEAGAVYAHVTMTNNSAEYGGALYSDAYGTEIDASTLSGNIAAANSSDSGYGGAIYDDEAPLHVVNSTLTGNDATAEGTTTPGYGGAIYNDSGAPLSLDYSTVAGNSVQNIPGNTAPTGGALYSDGSSGAILGSIVAGNTSTLNGTPSESDCGASAVAASLTSLGHNVFGDTTCSPTGTLQPSDVLTTSPGLSTLGNYGGSTQTVALDPYSPAIGNGGTSTCPSTDQRGTARPQGVACDSGAYETAQGIFGVSATGLVAAGGAARSLGSVPRPGGPVSAIATTADHGGYWVLSGRGSLHGLGDAHFYGSLVTSHVATGPNNYAVAIASTPDGGGYWIATQRGHIYSFGDAAKFPAFLHGFAVGHLLAAIAPTPDGKGLWVLTANGVVKALGDAQGHGMRRLAGSNPAVAIVPTFDGGGYFVETVHGNIFSFGDAHFYGSPVSSHVNLRGSKVVALLPTPDHQGYYSVTSSGRVYGYGDAMPAMLSPLFTNVVAAAAL